MGKPLINKEKWSQDEFRLLVVLLLTVLYPIALSCFFAIFFFLLMPIHDWEMGSHIYWLTASLIWVALCCVILPCFRSTEVKPNSVGMDIQEGPMYSTKPHAVQPFVKIEATDGEKRASVLTGKSRGSNESIEKGLCEEKAEREALEKSQESFKKSTSSLEKAKITQSGEFLNEFMGSLDQDQLQEEEAECEVYTEKESKELKLEFSTNKNDAEVLSQSVHSGETVLAKNADDDKLAAGRHEQKESDDDTEILSHNVTQNESTTVTLDLQEGDIHESEILKDEQVSELPGQSPVKVRKPLSSIDTSRADGYYECSMPTPKSANDRPESNMVFLFVNPETAATENDIIVNHQGEVQEHKD